MKHCKYLFLLLICSSVAYAFTNHSFMTYRPQELNLARADADWNKQCDYHHVSVAVEYTRSFDAGAITNYFFGCNGLSFSGSRVSDRNPNDILADYFGLPTDFKSKVCFSPRVQNVITDINFYWNLPTRCNEFNVYINVPLVYSKWELNPCETVINTGTAAYPAGYMSAELIMRDELKTGALDVLSGKGQFGDLTYPLQYGRIVKSRHATKISDIVAGLGYTFICDSCGLFGIDINLTVPTGTRSTACTIFEPQIGNGHHWALGFGLNGRYDVVGNEECDWGVAVCLDAKVQHLFATNEMRSYDLKKNGPGSRYILLEDMVVGISMAQGFSPIPGEDLFANQYITRLLYAIDATTLNSKIRIDAQGEVLAQLKMHYGNWNFNMGYDFWARSKETLVCREALNHKFYGIKGDAQVYGFLDIGSGILSIPLNATQSQAILHAGQGDGNTTTNFINSNADNAALVYNVGSPVAQTTPASLVNTGATTIAQVNGSNQAVVLTDADINNCSGLSPRAFSNKIFGTAGYTWNNLCRTKPYIMLGAEGEFAGKVGCVKTAVSQWGVWLKGGVNY